MNIIFDILLTLRYEIKFNKDKLYEEGGKFSLDVAKLIIGGVVLASIVKEDIDPIVLIGVGMGMVLVFVLLGFFLVSKSDKKDKRQRNFHRRTIKRKE